MLTTFANQFPISKYGDRSLCDESRLQIAARDGWLRTPAVSGKVDAAKAALSAAPNGAANKPHSESSGSSKASPISVQAKTDLDVAKLVSEANAQQQRAAAEAKAALAAAYEVLAGLTEPIPPQPARPGSVSQLLEEMVTLHAFCHFFETGRLVKFSELRTGCFDDSEYIGGVIGLAQEPVSYTHLTLPTNREV